jgi:histidine phosphotransferase ChpT
MQLQAAQPGSPPPLRLAGTLCARLCHDLAGTLGALTGTLELAEAEPDAETLAVALACARELTARLRLLRAAWAPDGSCGDLAILARGLPGSERLRVDVNDAAGLDAPMQRLALALMMVAASALPRGGAIRLGVTGSSLSVEIDGPGWAWPAALAGCLGEAGLNEAAGSPRGVACAMARLLAEEGGRTLRLDGACLTAA